MGECIGVAALIAIGFLLIMVVGPRISWQSQQPMSLRRYQELDGLDGDFDGEINPDDWFFKG